MTSKVSFNISHNLGISSKIKDVYSHNLEIEIKKISELLDKYPVVSIDTEFPGIIYQDNSGQCTPEIIYSYLKKNVDQLKIIQLGITLSDANGNYPSDVNTWQFNFDFNVEKERANIESINLLVSSGINFDSLCRYGISVSKFSEAIMCSGLILNDNITWITFHGSYDLAYFLKIITGLNIPETVEAFMSDLEIYFCNFYDIRHLVKDDLNGYKLSLNKLAYDLGIERTGNTHQAGSDSWVTSGVFTKVKQNIISENTYLNGKNKLFYLAWDSVDFDGPDEEVQVNSFQDQYFNPNTINFNYPMYENTGYNIQGIQNMQLNNLGMNMNNLNMNMMNMNPAFFNLIQNPMIKHFNPAISTFNSGGSSTSGSSFSQSTVTVKKKKSKKDKKKKNATANETTKKVD
jgi:CCR4-NOT transcription complex subunit 7/8